MNIVFGASGHVGSAILSTLLKNSVPTTAITHSAAKARTLEDRGAKVCVVDLKDVTKVKAVLSKAKGVFVLNPPADVKGDSVREELETADFLVEALRGSDVQQIVVESTQGARPGEALGDLSSLYHLEEGVRALRRPTAVTRAGYYMSNWEMQLGSAKEGKIKSFFPAEFKLPMIAPADLGKHNAEKMMENLSPETFEITDVSGPEDYSAQDVANAFGVVLQRNVEVEVIPPEKWIAAYRALGFSATAAESFSRMTRVTLQNSYQPAAKQVRTSTTIEEYLRGIV